ncbi:MAG: hypothetical protein ACI4QT_01170, partial [Kiritimatiellia bacterium]
MMKSNPLFLSFMIALCAVNGAKAQETTDSIGWLQSTGGTYSYNDPANWLDGNINGLFGTNLDAKATIRMRHESPLMLTNGMYTFLHSGEITFEFIGDQTTTPVPAYLTEDVTFSVPNATKGNIRFGANATTEQMYLDLGGGTRTIRSDLDIYLWQGVKNGNFCFGQANPTLFKWVYFVNEACVEDGD